MDKQTGKKGKRLSVSKIVLLILLILFLLSGIIIFVLQQMHVINIFGRNIPDAITSSQSQPSLANNGQAQNGAYKQSVASSSKIEITDRVSSAISFPDGKTGTEGEWICENVKQNKVIEQALVKVGNQPIAESVPIKPGQYINKIVLLRSLKQGSYTATIFLNYYDVKTHKYMSTSGYKVSLTVG